MEAEFDSAERDAWAALDEWRDAICSHCGNLKVICSTPGGLTGEGYHLIQHVCYATVVRDSTLRRIGRKFEKASPELDGTLPTDGVSISVSLTRQQSEDLLGLEVPSGARVVPPVNPATERR